MRRTLDLLLVTILALGALAGPAWAGAHIGKSAAKVAPGSPAIGPTAGVTQLLRFSLETGLEIPSLESGTLPLVDLHIEALKARPKGNEVFAALSPSNQIKLARIIQKVYRAEAVPVKQAPKRMDGARSPPTELPHETAARKQKARAVMTALNTALDGIREEDLTDTALAHAAISSLWDGLAKKEEVAFAVAAKDTAPVKSGLRKSNAARETAGRAKKKAPPAPEAPKKKKRRKLPIITGALLAANVGIFYAESQGWLDTQSWELLLPVLSNAFENEGVLGVLQESYRFVSSAFVHANQDHLLHNMGALLLVGTFLERRIGHWRVASAFMVSAVAASAVWAAVFWGASISSVGASGGLMGLAGALMVLYWKYFQHQKTPTAWKSFLMFLMSVGASIGMLALLFDSWGAIVQVGQLFEGFPYTPESNTNHLAHIVGLAVGMLAVPYWIWRVKRTPVPPKVAPKKEPVVA